MGVMPFQPSSEVIQALKSFRNKDTDFVKVSCSQSRKLAALERQHLLCLSMNVTPDEHGREGKHCFAGLGSNWKCWIFWRTPQFHKP